MIMHTFIIISATYTARKPHTTTKEEDTTVAKGTNSPSDNQVYS